MSLILTGVAVGVGGKQRSSAENECPTGIGCPSATDGDGGTVGGSSGGGTDASSWYGPDPDGSVEYLAENTELKSVLTFHLESFGLEDVLADPTDPAYRAYLWLANSDNLEDLSDFRRMQRFGMAALFYGTTVSFH